MSGRLSNQLAPEGHTHTQSVAAETWTVNHNLGYKPDVTLLNSAGYEYDAVIVHLTLNTLQVLHNQAKTGTARCS